MVSGNLRVSENDKALYKSQRAGFAKPSSAPPCWFQKSPEVKTKKHSWNPARFARLATLSLLEDGGIRFSSASSKPIKPMVYDPAVMMMTVVMTTMAKKTKM